MLWWFGLVDFSEKWLLPSYLFDLKLSEFAKTKQRIQTVSSDFGFKVDLKFIL